MRTPDDPILKERWKADSTGIHTADGEATVFWGTGAAAVVERRAAHVARLHNRELRRRRAGKPAESERSQ